MRRPVYYKARGLRRVFWFILNCLWVTRRGMQEEGKIPFGYIEE